MKSYGGKYCEISGGDSDESIYPKNTIVEEHTYYLKKEEHWLRDRCEGELLENSGRPQWGVQKCPQGLFPSFQNDVKFHENGLVKMNDVEFQSFVAKRKKDEIEYFDNKYEIKISEAEPPKPVASGFMGAGIAGAIAGLVLIGFIVDSKVGKK